MRKWACLLVLFGCTRSFEKLGPAAVKPSFLGDVSGLYLATNAEEGLAPRVVTAVAVDAGLILAVGGADGISDGIVVAGTLVQNAQGQGEFTQTVETTVRAGLPDYASLFPALAPLSLLVQAQVVVGFDAFTVRLDVLGGEGPEALCQVIRQIDPSSDCASRQPTILYEARKICDFDARLSGVYRGSLVGDCADPKRTGDRELVVVVSNASPVASILSLVDGQPEFGSLASFDPVSRTLQLVTSAQVDGVGSQPLDSAATMRVQLSVSDAATTAEGSLEEGGCTYRLSASRQTGAKAGLSCTRRSLCSELDFAACPRLPQRISAVRSVDAFLEDARLPCPAPLCALTLPKRSACNPSSPVLTTGCPAGTVVAMSASRQQNCFNAACVPNASCDGLRPLVASYTDACTPDLFVVRGIAGCGYAICP